MNLRLAALTILGTALLVPFSVQAGGHTVEKFLEADTDKNGSVSKEEFSARYNEKFTKMDGDSDGNVTAEEYEAYKQAKSKMRQEEMFKKMDANGDGMVSLEEMSEGMDSWKKKHH